VAHPACDNYRVADHDAGTPLSETPSSDGAWSTSRETATPAPPATDQDRNRYGLLLDKALERGLLTASDYQVRLRDLAEATSTDEMLAIVTDLPAFARATASSASRRGSRSPTEPGGHRLAVSPARTLGPARSQPRPGPWLILVVLVLVVVVALVVLGLSISHLHRSPIGEPRPLARVMLSALRL
jgi:hypothetical protein